ncbi:MAG: TolC family protein [Acidiferrobacteraceae bacterium]
MASAVAACARYHPKPLSQAAVAAALRPPEHAALVRDAKHLKMPPLAPMPLDFSRPLTPREVGVIAVFADPDLIALRIRRQVATAQVFAAGLLPNPVIDASELFPYGPKASGRTAALGAGFLWNLSRLFTRSVTLRISRERARAVRFQVAWREWVVANEARLLAVRLFWLRRSENQASTAATLASAYSLRLARARAAGAVSMVAASRGSALARRAAMTASRYQRGVQKTQIALDRLLGLAPGTPIALRRPASPPRSMPDARRLFHAAEKRRLDLVALRAAYQSAEARLHSAVLAQYPQIGFGLAAARNTSGVPSAGWQLTLTLPINGNRGAIAVARMRRRLLYRTYMARLSRDRATIERLSAFFSSYSRELRDLRGQHALSAHLADAARAAARSGALDRAQALAIVLRNAHLEEDMNNLRIAQAQSYIGLEVASGARWQEDR